MRHGVRIVCLALLTSPALAQEVPEAPEPRAVETLIAEAQAMAVAGRPTEAMELLEQVRARPGGAGPGSFALGMMLVGLGDLDMAIDAFKSAGEALSGAAKGEALGRVALAQELRGFVEADATAEAAVAADAEGAWPQLVLARARARAGAGDEAEAAARKAIEAGVGPAAHAALGFALETRGDLAAAEAAYQEGLAKGSDLTCSIGMARVLRKTGRAAEAEPLLVVALGMAPGAIVTYKESARVKLALNRPEDALDDAMTAAVLADHDPEAKALVMEAKVARALSYLGTDRAGLAIPDLQNLTQQDPDLVIAYLGLARAHITMRQPDQAEPQLAKALELEPDNAEALYRLGHMRLTLKNDFAGAVEPLQKASALDASNLSYRTEYGRALKHVQRLGEAVAELQKVTGSPGYAKADGWLYLGESELGLKNYAGAVEALDKAAEIAGEVAYVEAMLGWAHFGLKDAESFKKHAGKARELGYNEPTLLDYLKRIESGEAIK